jgi:hypothetical protein
MFPRVVKWLEIYGNPFYYFGFNAFNFNWKKLIKLIVIALISIGYKS